jgi:hypothetical protein
LQNLIVNVRRRWFLTVAMRTAGASMAAAAVPPLAALAVYWMFASSGGPLLLLTALATVLSIAAAWLVARRIEPRPDDLRVARFIEERAEGMDDARAMDDAVVSAVQASKAGPSDPRAAFAPLVVNGALRKLEGIDAHSLIPPAVLRRSGAAALGGAALLAVTLVIGSPALRLSLETARLRLFPQSVSVEVLPGDVRVVAGRPVTIRARLRSGDEMLSRAVPMLTVSAGSESRTVEMTRGNDGFEFAFESVDRSFKYKVTAGGVTSNEYGVTAIFPPRVARIDVHYSYPSFSSLKPRADEDGGDVYAPAGTRVRLEIHTDKPVASGTLGLLDGAPPLRLTAGQVLEGEFVVKRDDSYRVRVVDADGLASADDSEYFIRVMEDRPPDVRILRPGGDQGITPLQEVAIEARAEDDYGIASLDLVYSVAGGRERVVPFKETAGGATDRTGAVLLAAEELNVRPGDLITYYARARDVARGRRSTESQSDMFFLEVKPFSEEFVAAQSQASGAGGGDPQIEALIQAQKDIISATWNLERRAAAGRSADDVKAIAKAQAELKERVERTLGGRTRRGRGFMIERQLPQPPPQQRPSPQGDPIASAVEAMTKAIEQLASEKTRDAIPHEMSALNGLLQAQAEVRRRQIMQARGAGSGGGNRQSQDLSALFDKELQRQQRTNYEQRSQVEETQDRQQSNQDLQDRIKDLARRQEELNRQQRDLAQMQAEERKRQLERLAREQQELQRQVEELSKEMEQRGLQGQQSQQSGQQQSGQQQSGQQQSGQQQSGQQQSGQQRAGQQSGQQSQNNAGMRSALEQMRRAADDLRKNDTESAARNGERAADQLRQLEQQMRGNGADARQRAAADLQAEAEQIAQEQRRIAAEAERMEKSGAGDADARRRLAADKDRLSDRVDALKRGAERLGGDKGAADEQARAREAAAALEREKVGERMRQSARQMRDGARPSSQAEQQVARTLDQVVDKLGGAASADARKLADQLDQSRQIREKLDQLEAQMRQAEGRNDGDFEKLRQQYQQELARARDTLGRASNEQRDGSRGGTPEQQEFSRSAPGTEAFKQDRSNWQSLRKDVDRALEEHDAAVSRQLAKTLGEDRLNAGGSERIPEQYRRLVAKYYESLARTRR